MESFSLLVAPLIHHFITGSFMLLWPQHIQLFLSSTQRRDRKLIQGRKKKQEFHISNPSLVSLFWIYTQNINKGTLEDLSWNSNQPIIQKSRISPDNGENKRKHYDETLTKRFIWQRLGPNTDRPHTKNQRKTNATNSITERPSTLKNTLTLK